MTCAVPECVTPFYSTWTLPSTSAVGFSQGAAPEIDPVF